MLQLLNKDELKDKVLSLTDEVRVKREEIARLKLCHKESLLEIEYLKKDIQRLRDVKKDEQLALEAKARMDAKEKVEEEVSAIKQTLTRLELEKQTLSQKHCEHIELLKENTTELKDKLKDKESDIKELDTLRHTEVGALKAEIETLKRESSKTESTMKELLEKITDLAKNRPMIEMVDLRSKGKDD